MDCHTVIDAEGRHGHCIDGKAAQRDEVIAVADTDVGLMQLYASDVVTEEHQGGVFGIREVERGHIPRSTSKERACRAMLDDGLVVGGSL